VKPSIVSAFMCKTCTRVWKYEKDALSCCTTNEKLEPSFTKLRGEIISQVASMLVKRSRDHKQDYEYHEKRITILENILLPSDIIICLVLGSLAIFILK
jgi:hypothetical protein